MRRQLQLPGMDDMQEMALICIRSQGWGGTIPELVVSEEVCQTGDAVPYDHSEASYLAVQLNMCGCDTLQPRVHQKRVWMYWRREGCVLVCAQTR